MAFTKEELGQLATVIDDRLDRRFIEERAYYRQLIKDELADIRMQLEKLTEREEDDATSALKEIESLKKRLTRAEREIAKLKSL